MDLKLVVMVTMAMGIVILMELAVASSGLKAPPEPASVKYMPPKPRHYHGNNTGPPPPRSGTTRAGQQPATYHGGAIAYAALGVYLIFWNNNMPLQWNIYDYVANLGSTPWARVMDQYTDSAGRRVDAENLYYSGYTSYPDPNAPCATTNGQPCTIDDNQIRAWLTNYDAAQGSPGPTRHYAIFFDDTVSITANGERNCANFCGYHSYIQENNGYIFTYSVYVGQGTCTGQSLTCGSGLGDLESVISHEIAETLTDPFLDGWYDGSAGTRNEIGDICAWQLATVSAGNGNSYTVQKIWSNAANACVSS